MAIRSGSRIKPTTQRAIRGMFSAFGNAIVKGRAKNKWSKAQLASKCGLAVSSISNFENGKGSMEGMIATLYGLGYTNRDVARFISKSATTAA